MLFKDIIGQQAVKKKLLQGVSENRIPHAQLFAGNGGMGELPLAIAYARYLNCKERTADDSCGKCSSCVKFNKLIHPDLHFVFPVFKKKTNQDSISDDFLPEWRELVLNTPYFGQSQWFSMLNAENKQFSIFKQESHQIIKKLNLKTFEADYKTMIIWLPERMNLTAANKLLKMIEEPPPYTIFLLVSENPGKMLQTIISRTQLIKVPPIEAEEMEKAVLEKLSLSEQQARKIVHLANGSYLKALKALENDDDDKKYHQLFVTFMRYSYKPSVEDILPFIDGLASEGREKIKGFLNYSLQFLRECFIKGMAPSDIVYMSEEEEQFSQKFAKLIHQRNIYQLTDEFNAAFYHIESNGYEKIILLDLSIKISVLLKR